MVKKANGIGYVQRQVGIAKSVYKTSLEKGKAQNMLGPEGPPLKSFMCGH
jgi:hypothetical protein